MNSKKLVSAVLTATTVLWMVGAAALPVSAQTTSSLQAQIAALLAQIQQLQSQLNTSGSTTTTTGMTYDFTSNLTVGSTGAQVSSLQQLLISEGYLTAVSAPTGYFGTLTQTALGKFQAANGISPDAGYFGPITRAFVNSMSSTSTTTTTTTGGTLPAGCTSTSGYSPTTGASCSSGMSSVVAPSTGLAVSLASTNPAAGSLISSANSGSARVPVMAVNFTAGNSGAVTLSGVNFQKTGVLSDSAVSGAYLVQNGQVLAQYNSLNSGLLSFSGLNLSIPAGQTVTLTLAVDVAGGLSAGNTTAFALPAASDVTAFDSNNNAVSPSGSFPLNGNVFTVTSVTNPSLATLIITSSSIGTSVTAGTQGNIVGAWNFQVANSPVYLDNINFHVIGSANVANLQNVKLLVNGTQVGQTLASVPASGMADFDASAAPAKLGTGGNNVQVVADVMGSPSDYFQFEVLNGYDVLAVDSQYNVPVTVTNTGGIGTEVGIQQGTITVTQDANTPTGNIAKGQSSVTLAQYDIYAAGEPVKVKFLDFNVQLGGVAASEALSSEIQNVTITDDAGNQVGTSINQPPTNASCAYTVPSSNLTVTGAGNATVGTGSVVYADCFGTSASPINYIVPANTTRVLSMKADIQTGANFSTITGSLSGDSNNLQGMTSSQTGSTGSVNGVALTLVSSSMTPAQNNALGSQTVSAGTTGIKIGSYSLSASSAEGVNVNTVAVELTPGTTTQAFQNLKLLVNGTQFGTTQGVISGNSTYTFSGSAFNVPAGQTVNVDVYADSLSSATGTYSPATALVGYTGVGQTSNTSISIPAGEVGSCGITTGVCGQNINFNGQPALTLSIDSTNPPAGQIVQNSTGNTLAVFRFTETSNVENVKVSQLNIVDKVASSGVKAAYSNVTLWNGSINLGSAVVQPTFDSTNVGWDYDFNSLTNLVVPQGNSVSLTLKGDAGSYTSGSFTDNTTSTFEILSTGGSSGTPASSTIAVSIPAPLATSTAYSYDVTANAVTTGYTSYSLTATSTAAQEAQIATEIATLATNSSTALGLTSATASGTTVVFVSTGTSLISPSAAIWTIGPVTSMTANNTGTGVVSATSVVARGATSNKTAAVTFSNAVGNPMTVLQTTITPSLTVYGGNTQHNSRSSQDKVSTLNFAVNSANSAALNTVRLTFSGNLISATATSTFLAGVDLLDPNGLSVTADNNGGSSILSSSTGQNSDGSIWKMWTFNTTSSIPQLTAGSNEAFTVVVNDNSGTATPTNGISYGLQVNLQNTTDLTFYDGLGTGNTLIPSIPVSTASYTLPLQTSISFVSGS